MATSTTGGNRNPVEALAEEFLDRRRRGEPATPEEYAEAHPELADEILVLFPSLLMMEDLAADSGGQTGSLTSGAGVIAGAVAGRFGDFRLLREVGRGGMGVVYEAEQESLGRRVALKVLPAGALADPKQVRRFEREARSAARLHHTSIVPVFGVGQHEGTHYYVMQFIQGQGLDAVLDELRRLRDSRAPKPNRPATGATATQVVRRWEASEIARSLATGRFAAGAGNGEAPPGTATLPWSAEEPTPSVVSPSGSDPSGASATSGISAIPETDRRFAQGVARIGVQVAEALAYAHGQGILHRDIKPSNLLLDRDGNVWVADFGLAKAVDAEDLTHTGDILGTVRYMAPERFRGEGDARADLYALGLTLYELLALRPAYEEKDRAGLIRQVMEEDPPRLRKLNRRVPPDLETIVHKAIAREPGQRYASARAMAEDLQRFLEGRPIWARRVSPWERAWRWCKRNPAVAGLLGTVALLLVGFSIASAGAAAHFRAAARSEELARKEAERASERAEESRRQAEAARVQAEAARAEAQRQSRAAEASFALARQAVDDSFTRVSESKLLNVPGLRALRADLLGSALAFYDQFLREHGDDPSLKRDALRIRLNVARVLWELGRTETSKDASRAAAAGYEQALREDPDAPDLKAGLAEALYRTSSGQRADSAIAVFRRAVALREEVLKARPGDLENKRELAQFYNDLGIVLEKVDPAERLAAYDRCVALRLELAEARPDDPDVLRGLFQSFNNLAAAIHSQGNTSQSLNLYRRAEEFGREALRLRPNDADLATGMRIVSRNVTGSLWALGRKDEAIAECRTAVEMLRAMARANPEAPAIQAAYIQTSEGLAHYLAEHGQPEEAVRALIEPIGAFDRYYRDTAENLMSVASRRMAFARRIGEIKPDLTPEQKAARDALVDRAIDDYREAVARGAGLNIGALRKQPLLKDHPRFAALVAEADAVAKARLGGRAAAGAGAPSGPRTAPARPRIDVRLGRATAWSALGLARARARNGRADEALATLDRARALFDELARERPGDPDVARGRAELRLDTLAALHGLSLASLKAGRADESASYRRRADALFDELPRSRPAGAAAAAVRADALFALAEFHRKQGRWPETYHALRDAEALIGRALDSTPDEATARMLEHQLEVLGFEYFRLYLLEDATRAFRARFVRPSPHQTAFMGLVHAIALLLDGDVRGYHALCARMIERYRSSRQAEDLGRLVRVVTLRPDTLTDWGPMVALGRRSAELAPENDRAPFGTQLALIRAGRGRETLAWMESNPFFSTWLPRAMVHHRLGQTAEARAWLRKSDDYLRDFTEVVLAGEGSPQKGWWWVENWGMSVIGSREAHELIDGRPWPDAAWMRLQRARVLARVGEASRSDAEFAAVLADRPDDPEVWLGRAQADAWLGRLDRARDDADRAARLGPGTALGWETLGRALAAAGRAGDAARAFARAVERARAEPGGDREVHLRRAQVWVALDRPEEASRDFARALDLSRTAGDPAVKEAIDLLLEALNPYLRDRRWGAALALLREISGRAPSAADFPAAGQEDVLARDLSALLAINGDREGWARHNARVLDGLRGDRAPTSPAHLPAAVSLAPWPAGDPGRVLALCERVSARFPRSIAPYYLAMAHLRAGRPAEALRRIAAADRTPSARYPARRLIDLVAAIAHHRLGHAAEARRLYDESLRWLRAQQGEPLGWWADPFVYNALTYEALRREAEALIVLDPAFPTDPFAP